VRLALLALVALLAASTACSVTCDPPRHVVVVQTLDGWSHHECVSTPTSPPGTPPAANARR